MAGVCVASGSGGKGGHIAISLGSPCAKGSQPLAATHRVSLAPHTPSPPRQGYQPNSHNTRAEILNNFGLIHANQRN